MHLGDLCAANAHPLHADRLNECTSAQVAGWITEDAASARDAERLVLATPATNLFEVRLDQIGLARSQGDRRPQDHFAAPHWPFETRFAIAERGLGNRDLDLGAIGAEERDKRGDGGHLAPMRASIRPDRATDVPRNGERKLKPGEPRLGGNR